MVNIVNVMFFTDLKLNCLIQILIIQSINVLIQLINVLICQVVQCGLYFCDSPTNMYADCPKLLEWELELLRPTSGANYQPVELKCVRHCSTGFAGQKRPWDTVT